MCVTAISCLLLSVRMFQGMEQGIPPILPPKYILFFPPLRPIHAMNFLAAGSRPTFNDYIVADKSSFPTHDDWMKLIITSSCFLVQHSVVWLGLGARGLQRRRPLSITLAHYVNSHICTLMNHSLTNRGVWQVRGARTTSSTIIWIAIIEKAPSPLLGPRPSERLAPISVCLCTEHCLLGMANSALTTF